MSERSETWLLVDPVGDQVYPVSTRAFDVITAPKATVLARNCVALFLASDGVVRRIEDVEMTKNNLIAKLRVRFSLAVPAQYKFETVEAPLEDIRTMVLDAMMYFRKRNAFELGEWWLYTAPEDEVRNELAKADTLEDLHARLRFPEERDCLDLL